MKELNNEIVANGAFELCALLLQPLCHSARQLVALSINAKPSFCLNYLLCS